MTGIYKIENLLNGKIYIGQSINIEDRWKRHLFDSRPSKLSEKSSVIHKAIGKYGAENFKFFVVEECQAEDLDDREIYWIDFYDSYYNGYNCTKGGSRNVDHFKKRVYYYDLKGNYLGTFESVKEAAATLDIMPLSISNCCLGKNNSTHGFQFSYIDGPKGPVLQTNGAAKVVGQFTKSGELVRTFSSASDAARAMNISKYSISDCCRGRQKSSVGYVWKYL